MRPRTRRLIAAVPPIAAVVAVVTVASFGGVSASDGTSSATTADPAAPSAGARDTSFGTNGVVRIRETGDQWASKVAGLPDGKVLVVGVASENGVDKLLLRRLDASGSVDTTFGTKGLSRAALGSGIRNDGPNEAASIVAPLIQSDGKIVVAVGAWSSTAHTATRIVLARFTSDGVYDGTFGTAGRTTVTIADAPSALPSALLRGPDGTYFVAFGSSESKAAGLVRLTRAGRVDTTYGTNGALVTVSAASLSRGEVPYNARLLDVASVDAVRRTTDGSIVQVVTYQYQIGMEGPVQEVARIAYAADGTQPDPYWGASGFSTEPYSRPTDALALPGGDVAIASGGTCQAQIERHDADGRFVLDFGASGIAMNCDYDHRSEYRVGGTGVLLRTAHGRLVLVDTRFEASYHYYPTLRWFTRNGLVDTAVVDRSYHLASAGVSDAPGARDSGTHSDNNHTLGAALASDGKILIAVNGGDAPDRPAGPGVDYNDMAVVRVLGD